MKKILFFLPLFLLAQACCEKNHPASQPDALPTDKELMLLELNGSAVPALVKATIRFGAADKRYGGNNSCNSYSGAYELTGSSLKFGPAMATKKFCTDTASWETAFHEMLEKVDGFQFSKGKLTLLAGKTAVAVFQ